MGVALERNDELSLQRRVLINLGGGFSPVKNNTQVMLLSVGVALNSELATDSTNTTESLEGAFTAAYSLYHYDSPKADINTSLSYFPSITERGRYRVNYDLKLRYELISDLFFEIDYYMTYDSNAPSGEGEVRDYGITTGLGWSY